MDTPLKNIANVILKENRGLGYERSITDPGGEHNERMKQLGIIASRGGTAHQSADAHIEVGGTKYGVEIKSKGAANGQSLVNHDGESYGFSNTKLGNPLHALLGAHGDGSEDVPTDRGELIARGKKIHNGLLNDFYHTEEHGSLGGSEKNDINDHWRGVHEKQGELHLDLSADENEAHDILNAAYHNSDKLHVDGHGTYALNKKVATKSGVPYILDHMDKEALSNGKVLSMRHRVKYHGTNKKTGVRSYSPFMQLNINKSYLKPSTHDMTTGQGYVS